jgi:D-alanyl-D-alanine carboxypeptidase
MHPMKRILSFGAVTVFVCACDASPPTPTIPPTNPPDARATALQKLIDDDTANHDTIQGQMLAVHTPSFAWSGAAGNVRPTDVFRAASITKTFVAAATLVLVEQEKLALSQSIDDALSAATLDQLTNGGYDVAAITIRQLLTHTAGLYDYTQTDTFNTRIFAEPTHRWTRAEQIALAMDEGDVLNAPGTAYAYGDTAYVLLGEVLERSTGLGLAESLRALLPMDQLPDTWLESLEPAPPGALAHQTHPLYGDTDTFDWDPSWDLFGGGGLVSSTADLVTFMRALFEGGVFADPSSIVTMITVPAVSVGQFFGIDGAMGIARFVTEDNVGCFAGYGFFGTEMVYCRDLQLTYARTTNQAEVENDDSDAVTDTIIRLFVP